MDLRRIADWGAVLVLVLVAALHPWVVRHA